jgi:hypothetical protein
MTEVKALFPIGKTQWRKWVPEQKIAFNEARATGVSFADAVKYVNDLELIEVNIAPLPPKKSDLLRALEDTLDGLKDVADVTPVATIVRATRKKKA